MIDFLNETPLEYPDKKRVVTAPYPGNLPGIRETWNECAKITLNDMALATGFDFSETVSMRYPDEREREHRRVAVLLALGVLFERQRRAAETDGGAADASALTEHPAAGLSSDTTLKAVNEKLDAALDTLNLITGKTNPDAAFSMRTFADGSGRFLPVDSPADTGKAGAVADADAPSDAHADTPTTDD